MALVYDMQGVLKQMTRMREQQPPNVTKDTAGCTNLSLLLLLLL